MIGHSNAGAADETASRGLNDVEVVVPRRRYGSWIGAAFVSFTIVWVMYQLFTNPGFQWPVVGEYFTSVTILEGLRLTVEMTALTMTIGILLGIVLAVMRLSGNPIMSWAASWYVWFFRGTPTLVQLIFWFNLASLFPRLSLGVPFGGPKFLSASSNDLISPFTAALLGLGLDEAAYMAEIVRGGILSADPGQVDASKALGMRSLYTLRRVVLPQAMRSIVPATGNQTIGMLKYTSLASVVSLDELLQSTETIYTRTFQVIPLLLVASIWYLILTTVLSIGQYYIERYYARGATRELPPTPLQRLRQRWAQLGQSAGRLRLRKGRPGKLW